MKAKITMVLIVMALAAAVPLSASVQAQGNYALLVQASPPDAGSVTPGLGVHEIEIGQTVALAATPRPGYRFVYWLGDVSSSAASETTISIDSPKLIVAVFVREEFQENLPDVGAVQGESGGVDQRGVPNPLQSPGSISSGFDYDLTGYDVPKKPDGNNDDDIPVPDNNDDIPVPGDNQVPEPATVILLGLGAVMLRRRRNP